MKFCKTTGCERAAYPGRSTCNPCRGKKQKKGLPDCQTRGCNFKAKLNQSHCGKCQPKPVTNRVYDKPAVRLKPKVWRVEKNEVVLNEIKHKLGRFNRVYMWINDDWIRSNKTDKELRSMCKSIDDLERLNL